MAIAITAVPGSFQFEEVAGNNGAIANSLTFKITGGTFAGDNGDEVAATFSSVPTGLTPVLVKTSATTAKLTFKGTADSHAAAVSNLGVTFKATSFASGYTAGDALPSATGLTIDFKPAAAAGTLTLVPPSGADTGEVYKAADLPTITGTAPDGVAKVYIYNNGGTKPIGEAAVTGNAWTFKLPTEKLKDGAYSLTASASNDGKGAMTAGFAFTVDTKAPAAPSVNAIKGAISDTTPVLSGKAEKGAMVEVFADEAQTKSLGVTFADAKGLWTLAVANTELVTDGTYKITAKATDAAGNETKTKKAVDLIIDTTIGTPTLEATTVAKKNTVTLSGAVTGETGGSLQLYGGEDGSLALGKAIKINKDGTWKSSVKLTDGKHLLSVIATDAAGNVSDNSVLDAADIVTIDTFTATPTLELVKTGDTLTGLKGTAEAGAKVKITVGSKKDVFEATADASGNWVVNDLSAFTVTKEAKLKITAIATDAATNVSKASTAVEHTFKVGTSVPPDTTPPVVDTTAPEFVSAATDLTGNKIVLTYSEDLGGTAPNKGAFTVLSGTAGSEATNAVTGVTVSGSRITLTLTTPITEGQSVKVAYAAPAVVAAASNAAIQDAAGNDAATLATTAAINKVTSNASLAAQADAQSKTDPDIGTLLIDNSSLATTSKWNSGNVNYSFNTSIPSEYSGVSNTATLNGNLTSGWSTLNSTEKTVVAEAFDKLESLISVTFTETAGNTGDIRFNAVPTKSTVGGFAYYPGTSPAYAGDVFLSTNYRDTSYAAGGHSYFTVIHEIGHAMGLKHPFENPNILEDSLDNYDYTVMSYTDNKSGLAEFFYNSTGSGYTYSYTSDSDAKPDSWSILDIAAMQSMYGANTSHAIGNNTYSVSFNQKGYLTIWDAGGSDSINAATADGVCVVDLRPGTLSSFDVHTIAMQTAATQAYYQQLRGGDKGLDSWVAGVYANQWFTDHLFTGENNVGIAHGVWIENVTTGSAADTVRDNAVDNYIRTGAGDDIISLFGGGFDTVEGGTGTDTVFVTDAWGDIQTEKQTDGSYLVVGSYFAAQLIGVETLSYADGTLALT